MLTMDQIHLIRAMFYEQGKSISDIAAATGRNWKTVAKYIDMKDFNQPKPPAEMKPLCPKLDPYKPMIDSWLAEDKKHSRKQRHTAKRVFDRLKREFPDFNCSYRTVDTYVGTKKKELNLARNEGFLPLQHYPGEAQADFGTAEFYENGTLRTGKYLVLSFPWSNAGFLQLNYGENAECLLEGLDAIFRFIDGVPHEIWFDNASAIVTKVIRAGNNRTVTDKFTRFAEHYGFKAVFMNPAEGHEKGNVENKVGYTRSNLLVPVPRFMNLLNFNADLLKRCMEDMARDHYYKGAKISELFTTDQRSLLPLPEIPFDLSTTLYGITTDPYGMFTLDNGKHKYSTSPKHANRAIIVRLTSSTVTVLDETEHAIVIHRRLYGEDTQPQMDWIPYLDYISRHPRSLRNTGIYAMMPEQMQAFLSNCSGEDKHDALKILSELTERTGFDSALKTVDKAIQYKANDPDSLRSLYRSIYSDVPALPPMAENGLIPQVRAIPVKLSDYDELLRRRGDRHVC